VLSAVSGLKVATAAMSQQAVQGVTVAILAALFAAQPFGTGRVRKHRTAAAGEFCAAFLACTSGRRAARAPHTYIHAQVASVFAPVVAVWLLFNAALGLYNMSAAPGGWAVWQARAL
jgi:K+ transporter